MTDDNFEEEKEKIITEKINQSVVSLKELIRGTGNIIMFGFFVAFPLLQVMVIRRETELLTLWSVVPIVPLFVLGSTGLVYFTIIQNHEVPLTQKEWLSLGIRVDLLKIISWISIILFLSVMDEVPAKTFYVFSGILIVGIILISFEIQQFRFFLYHLDRYKNKKGKE